MAQRLSLKVLLPQLRIKRLLNHLFVFFSSEELLQGTCSNLLKTLRVSKKKISRIRPARALQVFQVMNRRSNHAEQQGAALPQTLKLESRAARRVNLQKSIRPCVRMNILINRKKIDSFHTAGMIVASSQLQDKQSGQKTKNKLRRGTCKNQGKIAISAIVYSSPTINVLSVSTHKCVCDSKKKKKKRQSKETSEMLVKHITQTLNFHSVARNTIISRLTLVSRRIDKKMPVAAARDGTLCTNLPEEPVRNLSTKLFGKEHAVLLRQVHHD